MTKEELRELAQSSYESNRGITGSSGAYADGFEACYRLLTTPRPMEEAPRDGRWINAYIQGRFEPINLAYSGSHWIALGCKYSSCDLVGWLPTWTPLEESK